MKKKTLFKIYIQNSTEYWYCPKLRKWVHNDNIDYKYAMSTCSKYFSTSNKALKSVNQLISIGCKKEDIFIAGFVKIKNKQYYFDTNIK